MSWCCSAAVNTVFDFAQIGEGCSLLCVVDFDVIGGLYNTPLVKVACQKTERESIGIATYLWSSMNLVLTGLNGVVRVRLSVIVFCSSRHCESSRMKRPIEEVLGVNLESFAK
jgi:hypothetical protein